VSHWRKENVVARLFISALSYWGAGMSGVDGTTLTAGWVAAEADGSAAGEGTGAAAIASLDAAGELAAEGDVRTSEAAALAADGAPSAAGFG
jgi:hypothetical protein